MWTRAKGVKRKEGQVAYGVGKRRCRARGQSGKGVVKSQGMAKGNQRGPRARGQYWAHISSASSAVIAKRNVAISFKTRARNPRSRKTQT